jgi:two-component system sensor kinase FixL
MLGVDRSQLMNERFDRYVVASDRQRCRQQFANALEHEYTRIFELTIKRVDGSQCNVRLDCLQVSGGGAPPTLRIALTDITERKHAEAQTKVSEERLTLALDASSEGLWDWDLPSGVVFRSLRYYEMMACTPEGGTPDFAFFLRNVHPDDRLLALNTIEAHKQGKTGAIEFDFRLHFPAGGREWIRVKGRVVERDVVGTPLRMVGTIQDVTERKQAEKALRESEMRWQFAVESHGDAMWDWDAAKDELFLTPAAMELFNLPQNNAKRPIGDLVSQLFGDDQAAMRRQIEDIVAGKATEWQSECRVSRPNRAQCWVATRGRIMTRDAEGRPHRIVSISRDITEDKRQAAEARRQRELMSHQGRLVLMGELASVLAHEVNQPLTAIIGLAAECARKVTADASAVELLRAIEDQAMRAGEISRRIRTFARRQRFARSALSLREVIAGVANWIRMDSTCLDVAIDVTGIDASLPPVIADRIELEQVLINLVRNGIEAYLPLAIEPRISIAACLKTSPDVIEVTVTDWGCGMPGTGDFETFQPFISSKEHGLGLGLTISFSIVESHGGRLWTTPNPAGGTVIHFTLPIAVSAGVT